MNIKSILCFGVLINPKIHFPRSKNNTFILRYWKCRRTFSYFCQFYKIGGYQLVLLIIFMFVYNQIRGCPCRSQIWNKELNNPGLAPLFVLGREKHLDGNPSYNSLWGHCVTEADTNMWTQELKQNQLKWTTLISSIVYEIYTSLSCMF